MKIRHSAVPDHKAISAIHMSAFGQAHGHEIVQLVSDLLDDTTAEPLLSLVAGTDQKLVGHVLFTKVKLQAESRCSARILAPLAVTADSQGKGIGGALIMEGLKQLGETGVDLVFVLGHPGYYPKFGFQTAGVLGYEAPYPIPSEHAGAWMVKELKAGVIGSVAGRVQCADALSHPQHWQE